VQASYPHHAASNGNRQSPIRLQPVEAHEPAPNSNGHRKAKERFIRTPQWMRLLKNRLTLGEQVVLHYIIDRTYGWSKDGEEVAIPYREFLHGWCKKSTGEVMDVGCGIKNREALNDALDGLVEKQLIAVTHQAGRTSRYRILPPTSTGSGTGSSNPTSTGSGTTTSTGCGTGP
jgi:hypothetical protein